MICKRAMTMPLLATGMLVASALSCMAFANNVTIDFNGIPGSDGSPFTNYTESGFTVSSTSGSWLVLRNYGNPPPYIGFNAPAGSTTTASIAVTDGGAAFNFSSVDLYSSTTPIPYTFTGFLNNKLAFTALGTVPNTFGNFALVISPASTVNIDTLDITLTDASAPCCGNPMGLDNISVTTTTPSVPEPGTYSLLLAGLAEFGFLGTVKFLRRVRARSV